jgi:short-subunit dehydrogenase
VPILVEQDEAHVVNTASAASFEALPCMGVYAASKHAVLGLSQALQRDLEAAGAKVGVTVLVPGGVVRSGIMSSERNWPADRLGALPDRAEDPTSDMVRAGFTQAVAAGLDPKVCAAAAVEGIKTGAHVVCDDPEVLDKYGYPR